MLCPQGALSTAYGTDLEGHLVAATEYILLLLRMISPVDPRLTVRERNQVIRARYAKGDSLSELARQFGISPQRIWQLVQIQAQ